MNLYEVEQAFGANISMLVYKAYYKTKPCQSSDKCPHGVNCYNIHNHDETRVPLCLNFYNKNCNYIGCDREHSLKLAKLPKELFNVLLNKLNNLNLIKDRIEKKVSTNMDKELDYQVNKVRENYRNKERKFEKELDELKNSLKKRKRYEQDDLNKINSLDKDNAELKEMNQYLISQIKQKDNIINDLMSRIQYYNLHNNAVSRHPYYHN